jgi:hypothetical protein
VAQVRYASRLSGVVAGQDYLGGSLLRFGGKKAKKCDFYHILRRPATIDHPLIYIGNPA